MTTISTVNRTQDLRSSVNKKEPSDTPPTEQMTSTVDISETTALMAEAEELASHAPDVDEAAVASIKEALEKGELEIDYERLAQKMLDFELTLFDS